MKVVVYAIARDEAQHVERFMETTNNADLVVIGDTGSTDGTQKLLVSHAGPADILAALSIEPFRFDDARNAALALVPADADICIPMDLDETLELGWREALERAWAPGTTLAHHTAVFRPGKEFVQTRIHARHGYRWKYPCHEGLYPDRITEQRADATEIRIHHNPIIYAKKQDYLPLLELGAAEYPHSARMAHYLGREYLYCGRHAEALEQFQRYMALPDPHKWLGEMAQVAEMMATCWRQ